MQDREVILFGRAEQDTEGLAPLDEDFDDIIHDHGQQARHEGYQPGHDAIQESFEPHIVKPLPLSLVYFSLLSWSSRAIMIERFNLSFRTSLLIVG